MADELQAWMGTFRSNISKTSASVSSGVPKTKKQMKARGRRQCFYCFEDLGVFEGRPESIVNITPEVFQHDGFGEDQWFHCLVAEQETDNESNAKGKIVGHALYHYAYCCMKGRTLYLETLYVAPNMRKKGIGMAFLSKLSKIAVEKKCYKMKWSVSDANQGAVDFYKKLGAEIEEEWKTVVLDDSVMIKLANQKT